MNSEQDVDELLLKLGADQDLEEYCHRCGDCCRLSIKATNPDRRILVRDLPCKFLDPVGNCSVYEDRFAKAPWCQDLRSGMLSGLYPEHCGYVLDVSWYKGSVSLHDDHLRYLVPYILSAVRSYAAPFKKADLDAFERKWLACMT